MNTFGQLFRITTFGESHGGAVGVTIDGCPPNIPIDLAEVQTFLNRRRPGQSPLTSPRQEPDQLILLCGIEDGRTLGTPITLMVKNEDKRPTDYGDFKSVYRPSHGDFTTQAKYGIRPQSGGGRSSARETIGRVAAAGIAEQVLRAYLPDLQVIAWVQQVQHISSLHPSTPLLRSQVDASPVRCPDPVASQKMETLITAIKQEGDSVGGIIACQATGCPPGLGEPVFDKLEADLAKAMLSLPASRGFEIGTGFASCLLKGSEHNDPFILKDGKITTATNHSGGIQAGISNGAPIFFRVPFKPVSTIFKPQSTVSTEGEPQTFQPQGGRHDPCVLPRAVPMVEAMTSLVLCDHLLRQRAISSMLK